jgi:zinc transport system ATP-binding protein
VLIDGVSFAYDTLAALENINLEVKNKEFLGIVGPNAGGKKHFAKINFRCACAPKGTDFGI